MTKEEKYKSLLSELGVYSPAFDDEIKALCILERELSRARKQWKATAAPGQAPLMTNPIYSIITQLQRDIHTRRNCLGLTPAGLKKLKGVIDLNVNTSPGPDSVLDVILKKYDKK